MQKNDDKNKKLHFINNYRRQELYMIEILIGALVAVGVGRYIVKGYSPTGVLLTGGVLWANQYYQPVSQVPVIA